MDSTAGLTRMQKELKVELGFVQRRLPWVIAGVAFVVYLITLNHSATFGGLVNLAKIVGWDWRPNVSSPLQVLLTFPVRYLPPGIQLSAINVIAAVCAAVGLGLLARCVALLPHDRTRDQRHAERSDHSLLSGRWAWLPPVLAALICGLQVSFWEHAVVGTGEALDLMIFAWLVHCLLAFRLDQRESRLNWFAFVYGLGMTNNYALIGFFPLFVIALIWIRKVAFFNVRFLLRITALGLCGLLLYLLLPTLALGANAGYSWWTMVKSSLVAQRDYLVGFPRIITVFLSLTAVLPVAFMGIRWPAQFGEVSPIGTLLTNMMTHLIHLVFLVACSYVAFDQFFSPRTLTGGTVAFLPFYFLGALTVGYCTGYFLLMGNAPAAEVPQWQRPSPLRLAMGRVMQVLVLIALVAMPAGLVYLNLPQILANTGTALSRITALSAKSLPAGGAIVLSDETFRLYALEHELRRTGGREKYVLIDTRSLESGSYHLHLLKRYPNIWPKEASTLKPTSRVSQPNLIQLLLGLAKKQPIYYLHPSFGYYFESFEIRPRGLAYHLRPFTSETVSGAPLSPEEIASDVKFWDLVRREELDRIIPKIPPAEFAATELKLRKRPVTLEMYVGRSYSQALNFFGVALQQAGEFAKAVDYFDLALKADPYNPAAMLNAEYNRQYRAGKRDPIKPSEAITKRISAGGNSWEAILASFGPPDEPASCYDLGLAFAAGNNSRQAARAFDRVIAFTPENLGARIAQLTALVRAGLPEIAIARIGELRTGAMAPKLSPPDLVNVAIAEAWAHATKGDVPKAAEILRAEQVRRPNEPAIWGSLFDIYGSIGDFTNAIRVAEEHLKLEPRNIQTLVNTAVLKGRLGFTNEALALYNRAIEISPKDEFALINRATLLLRLGNLDAAQKDFELLYSTRSSSATQVMLGLADVYFRKKNTRDALRLYRELRKKLPEGSPEHTLILERIRQLD